MTEHDVSRRQVLGAFAAGTAAIAGCSESNPAETPDGSGDPTEINNGGTPTSEEGEGSSNAGDVSLQGEEDFEEYLDSSVDIGEPTVDKPGYHWIEFENVSDQINTPVPNGMSSNELLNYNINEEARGEGLGEFDTMYIAVERKPDNSGLDVTQYFFVEDEWDAELSAEENMREANYHLGSPANEATDPEALESFLVDNVQDYDEVSGDLPEQYREWIEG